MNNHFIVEIGLEEVPARFVRDAMEQLGKRMTEWLASSRIEHGAVHTFATPRRLAVFVEEMSARSSDQTQEVRGPSRQAAFDEQGEWSKAAQGFARSQQVAVTDLYFKEVKGIEYVFVKKLIPGEETAGLLSEALPDIIFGIHFAKPMRWGDHDVRFIRPIRWLLSLFGEQVIPFHIAGVEAGRHTYGHRFLSEQPIVIQAADQYVQRLKDHYVIADLDERKTHVTTQINQLANEKGWTVKVDEQLLEEVLFLVEYPTVLSGSFDESFLKIPQEVLITSMREHQRYFPVLDDEGRLLPHFITVRNGDDRSLDVIAKGNEKVLHARLSDAAFFYEEDQQLPLAQAVERLDQVVFHDKLGSIGDKVRRIQKLAVRLGQDLAMDEATIVKIERAAALCKFDLVTQMVNEFPELQGTMGEDYARRAGEDPEVARAINEHYEPRFAGDRSPVTKIGAIVGIADKIDTIVGCFIIGIIPTGSQDPYALRRQAAGIVQTLHDHDIIYPLDQLFRNAQEVYTEAGQLIDDAEQVRQQLHQFFQLRIEHILSQHQIRYDIANALIASNTDQIAALTRRGEVLMAAANEASFKATLESFVRTINLADKASTTTVDPSLFENESEHQLYDRVMTVEQAFKKHLAQGEEKLAWQCLEKLPQPIDAFFDQVMVMVEDEQVKGNRLALLARIATMLNEFAAFQHIVV